MKKIGIITIVRTNNYGAELQALALYRKLQLLGFHPEIIDYLYYKNANHKAIKSSDPMIDDTFLKKCKRKLLYQIISPILDKFGGLFLSKIRMREIRFKKFHLEYFKFSKQYEDIDKLNNYPPIYDIYIVGSDQVWNPNTESSLSPYFLEFAAKDKLKISYASSFGVSKISKKYYKVYSDYLSNIDVLSVRESDGVDLIREISGRKSELVVDPTLLLTKDEWKEFMNKDFVVEGSFLLIYALYDSDKLIELAQILSEQLNLKVIMVTKRAYFNKKFKNIELIEDAGPSEFLSLLNLASLVITNSFHGTIFSINFNVPFFTILDEFKSNNSRMLNFLKRMSLEDRIVWENEVLRSDVLSSKIHCNFNSSDFSLNTEREYSISFLKRAVEQINIKKTNVL